MSRVDRPRAWTTHGVAGDTRVADAFVRGLRDLAQLIRPAYGASQRFVANAGPLGTSAPELLQDGATIAMRLTELDRRGANAGAMHLRSVMQRIHDQVGDGSSAGALIFEAIYASGRKAIAAGHHPVALREHLLSQIDVVRSGLRAQRFLPHTCDDLWHLAKSLGCEPDMADNLATVIGTLGPLGSVEVRAGRGEHLGVEWLDEPYWPSRPLERARLAPFGLRAEAISCAVFVSDLDLETRADGIALLTAARSRGASSLLVIARSCTGQCQQVLLANDTPAFRIFLMATPEAAAAERWETMTDIAIRTGARPFHAASGSSVTSLLAGDLGMCRRAWITRTHFGLVHGAGDSRETRKHLAGLAARYHSSEDGAVRDRLRLRYARLTGRNAILWVDGRSEREVKRNQLRAERAARVMQRSLVGGVVPGGGCALAVCERQAADRLAASVDVEERAAIMALRQGLRAPIAALAENAGLQPGVVINQLAQSDGGGFDGELGRVVSKDDVPVVDAFDVMEVAVRLAIAGAAQALTIDTIVFSSAGLVGRS